MGKFLISSTWEFPSNSAATWRRSFGFGKVTVLGSGLWRASGALGIVAHISTMV